MAKNNVYGLAVSLSEADVDGLNGMLAGPASLEQRMGYAAGELLRDFAKGGTIIPAAYMERIRAAIEPATAETITEHVERAAGRRGEASVFEWVVDPTQVTYYRDLAANHNVSFDHELKAIFDWAFEQGWIGRGAPEVRKLLFATEQCGVLQRHFGKEIVTGADFMREIGAKITSAEDDLVFDALTEAV